MNKYSDFRWCSPSALKCPARPACFLNRTELHSLCHQIIDPDADLCIPVFPDGEVIGDKSAATVRILKAMGVPSVRTHVVWIDCLQDVDAYLSLGVDVADDAHPALLAELDALTEWPLITPMKSSNVKTWWAAFERPSSIGYEITAARSLSNRGDDSND